MSSVPPLTARKRLHFDEVGLADPLDHELGDPVAPDDAECLVAIRVEQVDEDLAAVPRVDRAGRVDHRNAVSGCQPRARVDEPGIPSGEGDGDTGRDEGSLPGREVHVLTGCLLYT